MQELETALSDPYLWVFVLDMRDKLSKTNLYDLQQVFVGLVCNFYEERGLVYGVAPPCRPGRAVDPPAPSPRLQPDVRQPARVDEGTTQAGDASSEQRTIEERAFTTHS